MFSIVFDKVQKLYFVFIEDHLGCDKLKSYKSSPWKKSLTKFKKFLLKFIMIGHFVFRFSLINSLRFNFLLEEDFNIVNINHRVLNFLNFRSLCLTIFMFSSIKSFKIIIFFIEEKVSCNIMLNHYFSLRKTLNSIQYCLWK